MGSAARLRHAWLTGVLLLNAACTAAALSPDPADAPAAVSFTVTGGFAGIQERLEVGSDGHLALFVQESAAGEGRLADADRQRLQTLLASAAFRRLEKSYMPGDPCCDRFTYALQVERVDGTQRVTTMDGVTWPQPLADAIALLKQARS
jgi:hypothetical protein